MLAIQHTPAQLGHRRLSATHHSPDTASSASSHPAPAPRSIVRASQSCIPPFSPSACLLRIQKHSIPARLFERDQFPPPPHIHPETGMHAARIFEYAFELH